MALHKKCKLKEEFFRLLRLWLTKIFSYSLTYRHGITKVIQIKSRGKITDIREKGGLERESKRLTLRFGLGSLGGKGSISEPR